MNSVFNLLLISVLIFLLGTCRTPEKTNQTSLRIISLSPHITELIYALEADTYLVAVTDFCRYPLAARDKEQIGGLIDPNIEKMVSLAPTHLFGIPAHSELNEKVRKFGLHIDMYPNETWADMLAAIDSIAGKIGCDHKGQEIIHKMNINLDSIHAERTHQQPGVMLLIGYEKGSLRNATVAGPNTFIDEMLSAAGGANIYRDLGMRYGTVNIESMLTRQPEVIIDLRMEDKHQIQRLRIDDTWSVLNRTPAVRQGNIFSICGSHTLIPGPRMLWLARDFQAVLDSVKNEQKAVGSKP